MAEHGFCAECAADGQSVEAADELVLGSIIGSILGLCPDFDAVCVASFVEELEDVSDCGIDPGFFADGAGLGTVVDDLAKGPIGGDQEMTCADAAAEGSGEMQALGLSQRDDGPWIRAIPGQIRVIRVGHWKDALPVCFEHSIDKILRLAGHCWKEGGETLGLGSFGQHLAGLDV